MEIIRISVVGIAGVLLAVLLKQVRPEYALYLALTAGLIILYYSKVCSITSALIPSILTLTTWGAFS